ncbi:c-type cytochrome [Acidipila rosea]|uniref:Mono/diheme cytochrome c family protein n=1 Tax=Acidipila rosea TaxID=768535 RepID=A0A4R1LBJ6_9BACT|nr:cytochrome c [Acidipila rosea]MBW4027190.1 cytochrome c [Acidobacteriota bacterium]MBW4045767.1 cytochrome c [Acidobacteriota bacterium]TCK74303.1 mono/diheme cytochrome c family protein [Acidipila rosea]
MKKFLIGLLVGLAVIPIVAAIYLKFGNPPVAVTDPAFPFEKQIVHVPLHARIDREMPKTVPIEPSATNLEAGAHIYRQECAACHGLNGLPSDIGPHMYPRAPQLWHPHGKGVIGVSDDPPGETYWKVANGIRLTGMPAFAKILNETQMWQVSLLLANADKPLPPTVMDLMRRPLDLDPQTPAADPVSSK